jgi:hypothetical protein
LPSFNSSDADHRPKTNARQGKSFQTTDSNLSTTVIVKSVRYAAGVNFLSGKKIRSPNFGKSLAKVVPPTSLSHAKRQWSTPIRVNPRLRI